MLPALGGHFGIARSIRLSVRPSVPQCSCLGYRHAVCLQLSHRRSPEMCGLQTKPWTDVDPPQFLPPSNWHRRGHIRGRYPVKFQQSKNCCARIFQCSCAKKHAHCTLYESLHSFAVTLWIPSTTAPRCSIHILFFLTTLQVKKTCLTKLTKTTGVACSPCQ